MPKQKTCKAVSKRVKITATGKIKRHKANRRHLLSGRTTKRKRGLRQAVVQETKFGVKLRKTLKLPLPRAAADYGPDPEKKVQAPVAPVAPPTPPVAPAAPAKA